MTRLLCGAAVAAALLFAATPSSAQVVTMTANLNGGEETPILLTGAVGTAVVGNIRLATSTLTLTSLPVNMLIPPAPRLPGGPPAAGRNPLLFL